MRKQLLTKEGLLNITNSLWIRFTINPFNKDTVFLTINFEKDHVVSQIHLNAEHFMSSEDDPNCVEFLKSNDSLAVFLRSDVGGTFDITRYEE